VSVLGTGGSLIPTIASSPIICFTVFVKCAFPQALPEHYYEGKISSVLLLNYTKHLFEHLVYSRPSNISSKSNNHMTKYKNKQRVQRGKIYSLQPAFPDAKYFPELKKKSDTEIQKFTRN
jgi:hypothetical protein